MRFLDFLSYWFKPPVEPTPSTSTALVVIPEPEKTPFEKIVEKFDNTRDVLAISQSYVEHGS